jgi:hypothetical protein
MILDRTDLTLLEAIVKEITILLDNEYIHNQYGRLHELNTLRKDLTNLLKSQEVL